MGVKKRKSSQILHHKTQMFSFSWSFDYMISIILIFFSALLNSSSDLFFKLHKHTLFNLLIVIIILGSSFVLYYFSLKFTELSYIYPFLSLSIIFNVIFGKLFLFEQLTLKKELAILLIVVGLVFVSIGKRQKVLLDQNRVTNDS